MKLTKATSFMILTSAFISFFTGCKSVKNVSSIHSTVQILPSDKNTLFSYQENGKSGFYIINQETSAIQQLTKPVPGYLSQPRLSRDKKSIIFILSETTDGIYKNYIASLSLESNIFERLFEVKDIIVDISVSPIEDRLYLILAGDFGNSSPLVKAKPRIMDVFSVSPDDKIIKKESDFNAYMIRGARYLDTTGTYLYLNLTLNPNAALKSGPYRFNIKTKELTYLIPENMEEMHPEIKNNKALTEFYFDTYPIPATYQDSYFLVGSYHVYKIDGKTKRGSIIYQQSNEDRYNYQHIIKSVALHNQADTILIVKKGIQDDMLLIVKENGEQISLQINMAPFKESHL